jgi:hypothetical protein
MDISVNPKVTFVVPCYKLAHYLPECIDSILSQTYTDFEVLIMDNCSPDNTPEVAQSFKDPRVKHIRNQTNIGHLRNYNKGIDLARGKYVWQMSADDRFYRHDALERYVKLLDANPNLGYVFSSGIRMDENGKEQGLLKYSVYAPRDTIFEGRKFLRELIRVNHIVAPSVLVRKECYETISVFPLDLPWGADWYLWCMFAMHYDVGYLAEPMVCFRIHANSMTSGFISQDTARVCASDDIAVPWQIKRKAEEVGCSELAELCLRAVADQYARSIKSERYGASIPIMTLEQFEESLSRYASTEREKTWVRARAHAAAADGCYWQEDLPAARRYYRSALGMDRRQPKVWAKWFLLSTGGLGTFVRKGLRHAHTLGTARLKA